MFYAKSNVVIDNHIDTSFYKKALDELLEESKGTANENFYRERLEFFNKNN